MRAAMNFLPLILSASLILSGCSKSPTASQSPATTDVNGPSAAASPDSGSVRSEATATFHSGQDIPLTDPVDVSASLEQADLATAATMTPEVPPSMSRKEMLKLTGTGVVVVTALDALGEVTGFGSGCIVADGLVLTNHHVVSTAISAKVQTKGAGDELTGEELTVVGYRAVDNRNDLILLEVEGLPTNLYTFSVSPSDSLEQHDQVFSMGHPAGLKFSTTPGFVSALLKTSDMPEQLQAALSSPDTNWIQTNAVVSGGSSGGPLLDEQGYLVGINTLVLPESRIAFAVAATHVRDLLSRKQQPVTALPVPDADVITTRLLSALRADFDREFGQLIIDVRGLRMNGDAAAIQKLIGRNNPAPACVRECCDVADKHRGAPEAADALKVSADVLKSTGILQQSGRHYLDQLFAKAAMDSSLIPLSPRVLNSLFGLSYSGEMESYLRSILDSDQENSLKGTAGLVLVNAMASEDQQSLQAEMLELAEVVVAKFGTERFRASTIQDILTPVIDSAKLAVGGIAPDITGSDAKGETFRLSDYRGKVVMLDFWADWCPHCRNMYPEERELVEELKNQPFALLGVNGDEPERARRVVNSGAVTWRSWLDGSAGPIAELYQIEAWPTILVLDKAGRIRFSGLRGVELKSAIESLLDETPEILAGDVLAAGSMWHYFSLNDTDAPEGWNTTEFDDSSWPSGPGPFASAGLQEEGTDLVSYPPGKRPTTTLFRATFDVEAPDLQHTLLLNIRYQDGVTVFLNGTEIHRGNLRANAEVRATAIERGSDRSATGIVIPVSGSSLRPTGNCLAVSLHQYSAFGASPLLSVSLSRIPDLKESFETLSIRRKSELCRTIAQAGTLIPGAAMIVRKLQTDDSEVIRVSAAVAAAMNGLRVSMTEFTNPESHRNLFSQVTLLNSDAWKVVESSDFTQPQYTDALRMAKAAISLQSALHPELKSDTSGIENTLGVAYYRCGDYGNAIKMLKKSILLQGENPIDAAYLHLAQLKLGNQEEAEKYKTSCNELLKDEQWKHLKIAINAQQELNAVSAD